MKYLQRHLLLFAIGIAWAFLLPTVSPAETPLQKELLQLLQAAPESIDLEQVLFTVSRDWDRRISIPPLKKKLDDLQAALQKKIQDSTPPEKIIQAFRETIHGEAGYRFSDRVDPQGIPLNPEELFFHGLIETRRGYCMNLSLLYLVLAERLKQPLRGIPLPNHFFVRYVTEAFQANIETTQEGHSLPDDYYYRRFELAPGDSTYFMNPLNNKQTLGAYFSNVGMVMFRHKRTDDALFYLQQAVRLNPQAVDARNNLANLFSELKDYESAIRQYRKALESDPNNASTYFNLGLALTEAGRGPEAFEAFLQAAQLNPSYAPVHSVLSRLYMEKKLWHGALLHLQALADLDPRALQPVMQMAQIYLQMDQPQVALDHLQVVQRRFPMNLAVNEMIAEAHYRLKQYSAAIAQLEHIIQQVPEHLQSHMQLGWIHYLEGRTEEAITATLRGLQSGDDPKMTQLGQMNLGLYHLVQGRFDAAETWYGKALQSPNSTALSAMVQDLKEAASRFTGKPELEFYIGWLYLKAGKPGQGRAALKQFLDEHPSGSFADRARNLLQSGDTPASSSEKPAGMVEIPRGFFIMGSEDHGQDEKPEHAVFLDSYYIDETEVTAREYAEFLNTVQDAKKRRDYFQPQKHFTIDTDGKHYSVASGAEEYPATGVTWHGASAFCKWKDKRLPTEAEWEKAARGTEGRIYPWGNESPTPQLARYMQTWSEKDEFRVMMPVRSMPAGKSAFGLYHMAGNVKEWVDDWYDRGYYKELDHKVNPQGPVGGEFKVLKGGSWRDLRSVLYSSFRNNSFAKSGTDDYGFRCAQNSAGAPAPGKLTQQEGPRPVLFTFSGSDRAE